MNLFKILILFPLDTAQKWGSHIIQLMQQIVSCHDYFTATFFREGGLFGLQSHEIQSTTMERHDRSGV